MKKTFRLFGIIALTTVIVFAFLACKDDEDNSVTSAHLGSTLNLSGQVYTVTQHGSNVTYTPFTGDRTISAYYLDYDRRDLFVLDGGTGQITNGQFTFSIGKPSASYLQNNLKEYFFDEVNFNNFKISNPEVKFVCIPYFLASSGKGLTKGLYNVSPLEEFVSYYYVDRDVTISADQTLLKYGYQEDSTQTINAFNINFKTGWNAFYFKNVEISAYSSTTTLSSANPADLKWVLWEDYVNISRLVLPDGYAWVNDDGPFINLGFFSSEGIIFKIDGTLQFIADFYFVGWEIIDYDDVTWYTSGNSLIINNDFGIITVSDTYTYTVTDTTLTLNYYDEYLDEVFTYVYKKTAVTLP